MGLDMSLTETMPGDSLRNGLPLDLSVGPTERRKGLRFDISVPVLLRAIGDSWRVGKTVNVGISGAFLVTDRPLLLGVSIEYVLTFAPDLTKAPRPLRLRFFGMVVRCGPVFESGHTFGLAVRKECHHCYLSREQSAGYDAIEQQLLEADIQPHRTGNLLTVA